MTASSHGIRRYSGSGTGKQISLEADEPLPVPHSGLWL